MDQIKETLLSYAESDYAKFTAKLLPGVTNILGVRLPKIRQIAKEIAKQDWKAYLENAADEFHEEIMLQGMVIGYAKADFDEIKPYIEIFIPKISNWAVCDSFCSSLKISKKYPTEMWDFIQPYLKDKKEYHIRFGVVMLLNYFVAESYCKKALQIMDEIKSDAYYVKMAVAWAISMYYIKFPEETMEFLNQNHLDNFTYNKALQKITESLKIDANTKEQIRKMKRR